MTKEIHSREARQGRSKKNVLVILVISLALAFGALFIFEAISG
ncbi:MAG: hypothetical protein AAFO70_00025 [Pseudomonadota bacterium]